MLLYYIRHGDPIYDPDSLTPLGKRQAEAVARRLSLHGVDRIFASTSQRAKDTAAPTAELLHLPVTELDFANEETFWKEAAGPTKRGGHNWYMHQPEYRRIMNSAEIRALGDKWYTHEAFSSTRLPEGLSRIARGADEFLYKLGYEHDRENHCYKAVAANKERVAFFAHQSFGIAFLSNLLDIPYPMFATHFDISHSCVTVIQFDDGEDGDSSYILPKVLTFSNDSHIYESRLPTKFINEFYI
ncbi:MAG: histidine phosphatase family protein [Clostridia bacterium]|nr:histidine phosphatase family protein [Clostridia bacterium]